MVVRLVSIAIIKTPQQNEVKTGKKGALPRPTMLSRLAPGRTLILRGLKVRCHPIQTLTARPQLHRTLSDTPQGVLRAL